MLRQSPSRNVRTKGFKVKHALQIVLLLTVFVWLLYQVRHSYHSKTKYEDPSPGLLSNEVEPREEVIKFGRKDLINVKGGVRKKDEPGEDFEDAKIDEEEENLVEGRGGGDDEIDVTDQERAEEEDSESEMDDLIDEEDGEKEDASLTEETDGHTENAEGTVKVEEDELSLELVEGRQDFSGSIKGKRLSNGKVDASFYRDKLVDQNENPGRDEKA